MPRKVRYKLNREKEIEALYKEQRGQTAYEYKVNTKRFWQKQNFGSASEVRRIDPKTMRVIEVIDLTKNDNKIQNDGWRLELQQVIGNQILNHGSELRPDYRILDMI